MGAECNVHGTDLLGDQFSGFSCPSCERDEARAKIKELTRERDKGWHTINRIEEVLTSYSIAIDSPLSDAILDLICDKQAAEAQRDTLREAVSAAFSATYNPDISHLTSTKTVRNILQSVLSTPLDKEAQ